MRFLFALLSYLFSTFYCCALTVGAEQPSVYLKHLQGKQLGLVVNQTSLVHHQHLVDYLLSQHMTISAVFAPEHGFRGNAGAGELVADSVDPSTGLPIHSLYGNTKKPTSAMLKGVDLLVFDIQDVGARFYTYISTLHYVLQAAAEHQIDVLILDRPNPNGRYIDGPLLDPALRSFVGMHPIPVLHGMTVGELAMMIKGEQWVNDADTLGLTVIPVSGYRKTDSYSMPVPPSPNLPNDRAIRLYPSLCLFEATELSVGRGTAFPFQVLGHPNIHLGRFSFTPVSMPNSAPTPKHQDSLILGIDLRQQDIQGFDISLLVNMQRIFKQANMTLINRPLFFDKLSGTKALRLQLEQGKTADEIRASWQPALRDFKQQRQPYLLYPLQ